MFKPKRASAAVVRHLIAHGSASGLPTTQEAHILKCALRCFARAGYATTTVRTIASAAGVTAPMINYYFGSKEGLYRRVSELVTRAVQDELAAAAAKDGALWTRLMALMTAAIDFAVASPDAAAFMFDALYGTSAARPRLDVDALERGLHGVLERLIASAVARKELRLRKGCQVKDLQHLSMMVMGHVIGRDLARDGRLNPAQRNAMIREAEALLRIVIAGARG